MNGLIDFDEKIYVMVFKGIISRKNYEII